MVCPTPPGLRRGRRCRVSDALVSGAPKSAKAAWHEVPGAGAAMGSVPEGRFEIITPALLKLRTPCRRETDGFCSADHALPCGTDPRMHVSQALRA
jgi:hypothetical protein